MQSFKMCLTIPQAQVWNSKVPQKRGSLKNKKKCHKSAIFIYLLVCFLFLHSDLLTCAGGFLQGYMCFEMSLNFKKEGIFMAVLQFPVLRIPFVSPPRKSDTDLQRLKYIHMTK